MSRWKRANLGRLKWAVETTIDSRQSLAFHLARAVLHRVPGDDARRLEYKWLMVQKPQYACGLSQAGNLAKALGLPGFTAVEFGVGTGGGLIAMENHASWFSKRCDLEIDVVGFDLAGGLPPPADYRDVGYRWHEGQFEMDEQTLRRRLTRSQLVLGDIAETAPKFTPRLPIGFASFDMDYYSSTISALQVFEGDDWDRWLPRTMAYFDDSRTVEWVGERLAMSDWNDKQTDRKIGQIMGMRETLFASPYWGEKMFQIHLFGHPRYAEPAPGVWAIS